MHRTGWDADTYKLRCRGVGVWVDRGRAVPILSWAGWRYSALTYSPYISRFASRNQLFGRAASSCAPAGAPRAMYFLPLAARRDQTRLRRSTSVRHPSPVLQHQSTNTNIHRLQPLPPPSTPSALQVRTGLGFCADKRSVDTAARHAAVVVVVSSSSYRRQSAFPGLHFV